MQMQMQGNELMMEVREATVTPAAEVRAMLPPPLRRSRVIVMKPPKRVLNFDELRDVSPTSAFEACWTPKQIMPVEPITRVLRFSPLGSPRVATPHSSPNADESKKQQRTIIDALSLFPPLPDRLPMDLIAVVRTAIDKSPVCEQLYNDFCMKTLYSQAQQKSASLDFVMHLHQTNQWASFASSYNEICMEELAQSRKRYRNGDLMF